MRARGTGLPDGSPSVRRIAAAAWHSAHAAAARAYWAPQRTPGSFVDTAHDSAGCNWVGVACRRVCGCAALGARHRAPHAQGRRVLLHHS